MPFLSLAALTILDAGPAGQIRAAAAAGWPSVGLRLQPHVDSDEGVVGRPEREQDIRRLLAATGLGVLEIGVFPIAARFDAEAFAPVLEFSASIRARCVIAPIEDPDVSRRADHFARFAALAGASGLRALVEFNPYSACKTLASASELLDRAQAPQSGLCLDVFHLFRSGGAPEDLRAIAPERLSLLHFCDATQAPAGLDEEALRRESRTARRLPGEGALPLAALFNLLPPDLPISLEAPSPRLAGLSAEERARQALAATQMWFAQRKQASARN